MKIVTLSNRKNTLKTVLLAFAFSTFLSLFSSCTADELPEEKTAKQETIFAKDGAIDPPANHLPPKKP